VHAATDAASAPLDWRLLLPESWDDRSTTDPDAVAAITARRRRSAIPDAEHHRPKWEMAIEMIDELIEWGRTAPAAVADAGYGDATAFRLALTGRGIDYVVAVKGATSAYPGDAVPEIAAYTGRGRPPTSRYGPHSTCKDLILAAGRKALRTVTWRRGSKADPDNPTAAMRSRFAALRVRPANHDIPRAEDGTLPRCGCSPSGLPAPTSPPTTGSPPCRTPHPSPNWCDWRRSAGASSTTIGS
jgi:SRSO17 transposase